MIATFIYDIPHFNDDLIQYSPGATNVRGTIWRMAPTPSSTACGELQGLRDQWVSNKGLSGGRWTQGWSAVIVFEF